VLEVAANAATLGVDVERGFRRPRELVAELYFPVHPVADSLDAVPTRFDPPKRSTAIGERRSTSQ
jgi:hypothetical protein